MEQIPIQRKPAPGRRKSGLAEVKGLFIVLSITTTLGLWSLFSKQDQEAALAKMAITSGEENRPEDSAKNLVLNLPPLPTLIAPATPTAPAASASSFAGGSAPDSRPARLPAPPPANPVILPAQPLAPAKIFMGGSKPRNSSRNGGQSGTVTTTRSSR